MLYQPDCASLSTCPNDGGCKDAQKCCAPTSCNGASKCWDPIGLPQCIYDGMVYDVGEVFHPNDCTECRYTDDHSSGNPKYGGAICDIEICSELTCKESLQRVPDGKCCAVCETPNIDSTDALKFLNCPEDPIIASLKPDQRYHINEVTQTLQVTDRRNLGRRIELKQNPKGNVIAWEGNGKKQTFTVTATADNPGHGKDTSTCTYGIVVNGRT